MTLLSEQEIYNNLKRMNENELQEIIEAYDYEWDENESTSRNSRELAELISNRES